MHYEKVDLNNNMDRWVGKVAVVTGASSGIGAATAVGLVKAGLKVVGLARRVERVEELKKQIPRNATGLLFARKCDVSSEQEIKDTFAWIIEKFGGVDILVNNAGVLNQTSLSGAGDSALIRQTLDINILGLVFCTREAYQSMKSRGVAGHIIHINSIVGHGVPFLLGSPSLNIYPPSKYAVTAIAEVHRQEFLADASKVKVTVNTCVNQFHWF